MELFWKAINYFIFLHPLYMSFIWMVGGLLFFFRWERKKYPQQESTSLPFVSVIVPAHNEEGNINDTISHLDNLNYPHYEVIVVNDGSADKTPQILDDLVKKY